MRIKWLFRGGSLVIHTSARSCSRSFRVELATSNHSERTMVCKRTTKMEAILPHTMPTAASWTVCLQLDGKPCCRDGPAPAAEAPADAAACASDSVCVSPVGVLSLPCPSPFPPGLSSHIESALVLSLVPCLVSSAGVDKPAPWCISGAQAAVPPPSGALATLHCEMSCT